VHPATDPDDAAQVPDPVHFGDVREKLACEYVAQLCIGGQGAFIAAGNKMYVLHDSDFEFCLRPRLALALAQRVVFVFLCLFISFLIFSSYRDNRLDLVPLVSGPEWKLDQENLWRLPGAHGEEVVRSVCLDEQVCLTLHPNSNSQSPVQILSTSIYIPNPPTCTSTFHVLHSRQSLTNPARSRANPSSHAAKMGSCEHGSSLKRVLQSRLGLRGLGRRRRRRIALSRTS
jgi:hypothetical protein